MSNRMIVMSAERLHQVADAYDLPYDRNTVAENNQPGLAAIYCAPIGPAKGKGYGQAPFTGILQRVRRHPILKSGGYG